MSSESEFGKGYSYCLGLFLMHTFMFEAKEMKTMDPEVGIGLWFNGAADHLYEFEARTEREIAFKEKCLKWRIWPNPTAKDKEWALNEALELLQEYDKKNGYEVEKGTWE